MSSRLVPQPSPGSPPLSLRLLVVLHAAGFSALGIWRLRQMLYDDLDLALFTQAVAQVLRGSLASSMRGVPWLGDHSSLLLFLVAPLFALARSPVTLIVLQSAALALAAIPVWQLARRQFEDSRLAFACALLWLAQPALHFLAVFEFHPETLGVPMLLAALVAVRDGRTRAAALWSAAALLGKEDVALVILALAAYAWLSRAPRGRATAAVLAVLAVASLAFTFAVLKPMLGSATASYGSLYGQWGASPRAVALALLTHPLAALGAFVHTPGDAVDSASKSLLWLQLLLPLGALPLLAPEIAVIALPVLAEHLLSFRNQQHVPYYQYTGLVLPWFAAAMVTGLARLRARHGAAPAWAAIALALLAAAAGGATYGPFGSGALRASHPAYQVWPDAYSRTSAPRERELLAHLPAGGVVAGFGALPWVATREQVQALHHLVSGRWTFSTTPYPVPGGITSLVADVSQQRLLLYPDAGTGARLRALLARDSLVLTDVSGDLLRFERGARAHAPLVVLAADSAGEAGPVFDGELQYCGHALLANRAAAGGELPLRIDWRRIRPSARTFLLQLVVRDAAGREVYAHVHPAGYLFWPAGDWPEGRRVREHYALLLPRELAPGRYTLALRVGARLAGRTGATTSDDAALDAAGGTLELGGFTLRGRAH